MPVKGLSTPQRRTGPFDIAVTLTDYYGRNYANRLVTLYAVSLNPGPLKPPPGNPDNKFAFQIPNYVYTIYPVGMAAGTYTLGFTVKDDPNVHTVQFTLY